MSTTSFTRTTTATSTSASSASLHSYSGTFVAKVPTNEDPYVYKSNNTNGTFFICVGSIIIGFFTIMAISRFWYWMKNRKAAAIATKFDMAYYNNYDDDDSFIGEKSGGMKFFVDEKSSGTPSILQYDSAYFNDKKSKYGIDTPTSGSQSPYTHNSSTSTSTVSTSNSGSGDGSAHALNQLMYGTSNENSLQGPQQGRQLRDALTAQNGGSAAQTVLLVPRRRKSFISPINELISNPFEDPASNLGSGSTSKSGSGRNISDIDDGLYDKRRSYSNLLSEGASTPISDNSREVSKTQRRKNNSMSMLLTPPLTPQLGEGKHARVKSVQLYQLEQMVNKSLGDFGTAKTDRNASREGSPVREFVTDETPIRVEGSGANNGKKKSRPPSMVLDMLVQDMV